MCVITSPLIICRHIILFTAIPGTPSTNTAKVLPSNWLFCPVCTKLVCGSEEYVLFFQLPLLRYVWATTAVVLTACYDSALAILTYSCGTRCIDSIIIIIIIIVFTGGCIWCDALCTMLRYNECTHNGSICQTGSLPAHIMLPVCKGATLSLHMLTLALLFCRRRRCANMVRLSTGAESNANVGVRHLLCRRKAEVVYVYMAQSERPACTEGR